MTGNTLNSSGESMVLGHRIQVEKSIRHARALCQGLEMANTRRPLLLREGNYPMVVYFPIRDVNMRLLEPTATSSHCPYKGDASYWSIRLGEQVLRDAAWGYPQPLAECPWLREHLAFYADRVTILLDA